MAFVKDKLIENTRGKFYVDSQCIDCDVCRDIAPANFTRDDENAYSYVYQQPATLEEDDLCNQSMNNCPVEAIGNDG